MKFGRLIEYNKRNNFLQKSCRRWGWEASFRPLFVFLKKASNKVKESGQHFSFKYILTALNLAYNKNKLCKTLAFWSRNIFNFDFIENSLGIVSPPHFAYDFSRKMFLILYYITDQISWSDFLYFLSYLTVWYMIKKSRQKLKYLENKKSF